LFSQRFSIASLSVNGMFAESELPADLNSKHSYYSGSNNRKVGTGYGFTVVCEDLSVESGNFLAICG
jgi:hypothetical protein